MVFRFPWALALLVTLGPILLWHLRRLWFRRLVVPAVAPWLALLSTLPIQRRRVPRTLLLALHLAAAAAIAIAAAGPVLPAARPQASEVIVLDGSLPMTAGERWSAAAAEARETALLSGADTVVMAGRTPRLLAGPGASPDEIRAAVRAARPVSSVADLEAALELGRALVPGAGVHVVTVRLAPAGSEDRWHAIDGPIARNRSVTSAAIRGDRLFARVRTAGQETPDPALLEAAVRNAEGEILVRAQAESSGGDGVYDFALRLPPGVTAAEFVVEGDDAIPDDDTAGALAANPLRIQVVGAGATLLRALRAIPDAVVEELGRATYFTDGRVDLSVFVGGVPDLLPPRGVLIVAPAAGERFTSARDPEPPSDPPERRAVALDGVGGHPIGASLHFEGVSAIQTAVLSPPPGAQVILAAVGGEATRSPAAVPAPSTSLGELDRASGALGFAHETGSGRLVVLAIDPEDSEGNLSLRPAFPELIARAALWAADMPSPSLFTGQAADLPIGEWSWGRANAPAESAGVAAGPDRGGLYEARLLGADGRRLRFGVVAGDDDPGRLEEAELPLDPPVVGAPTISRTEESSLTAGSQGDARLASLIALLAAALVVLEGWWRGPATRTRTALGPAAPPGPR